jgi:hypothetical protein
MYFVSRQHYFYQNIYVVEIAYPSIDYSSPDMLICKYKGEGESFNNPIEALEAAISILEAWKLDNPNIEIGITYGHFDMCEGSPEGIEDLRKKVQKDYDKLQKCSYCNKLIDEKEYYINQDFEFSEEKFCSEIHAEKAYSEGYDLCFICDEEYQRKEMNLEIDIFICDTCKEKEN